MNDYIMTFAATALLVIVVGLNVQQSYRRKARETRARLTPFKQIDEITEMVERTRARTVGNTWFERKSLQLDQSQLGWNMQRYLLTEVILGGSGFGLVTMFFHSSFMGIMGGAAGLWAPNWYVGRAHRKNMELFAIQFRNALQRMASMLRAGGSVKQSIYDVATNPDTHPTVKAEFVRAHTDLEYGYTVEEAFYRMYERTFNDDVKMVSIVSEIQRQKGGNLAELFDTIQETITQRYNQLRKLRSLTSQQRAQSTMLTAIPFVVYVFFWFTNPSYYSNFLVTTIGKVITLGCIGLIFLGNFLMRKISNPN